MCIYIYTRTGNSGEKLVHLVAFIIRISPQVVQVEDIVKNLIKSNRGAFRPSILYDYITTHDANNIKYMFIRGPR